MSLSPIAIIAVSFLLMACSSSRDTGGSSGPDRPSDNRVETLYKDDGHYSDQIEAQLAIVVNTQDDLDALWAKLFSGQSPMPPVPQVDFTGASVVVASSGMKGSGGHGVTIETLEEIPEGMRLRIVAMSPGSTCMTTQALTTPLHIVRTRKLPAVVLFDWSETIVECE
ncbi:MAG TPA: protease complex subunit PrcB family protein [Candidatus Kapabacteria bacterium]|jgi:hypothetical protein|nr:protease complex subunit PrcB family protein [Candidatus Kapabacteria bacterium]